MPKGDRLKLKADPEDGTTPIANLLLEAVAMAKLSGLQKGCVLYLWRETYGWVDDNGKRRKEAKITLSEWAKAVDSTNPRVSRTLADLEQHHVIIRRTSNAWGGYYYSINTLVGTWNKDCINHTKLREKLKMPDLGDVTQKVTITENNTVTHKDTITLTGNSYREKDATVTENATQQLPKTQLPTLYKEILNKYKEKYIVVFKYWNSKNIIVHKKDTDDIKRAIAHVLKDYTVEEVCTAIDNYAEILNGDEYYFKHKWTLLEFLSRNKCNNIERFKDAEIARSNFLKAKDYGAHQGDITKPKPQNVRIIR